MSFDALTLSAVRDELEPLLTGARMQKIVFPDQVSLALEVFAPGAGRTQVLLSMHSEHARVQRLLALPRRGLERDTPFSLVARKHLRDARILAVRQPPLERVFEMNCEQRDDSGQHYGVLLIVEAMGRRSNLVLVDARGVILDAARRTPPSRNARRPILPHLPYVPPPEQERLFPREITAAALAAMAHGQSGSLARFLSDHLAGLSPLSGRELAFRGTGDTTASLAGVDWAHLAGAAADFLGAVESHQWQPSVAFDADDRPLEFAPYVLTHVAQSATRVTSFDRISDAMEVYYTGLAQAGSARRGDVLAAERRALLGPIEHARAVTQRRIAALEQQLASGQNKRDALRRAGELILTHQAQLPPGAAQLVTGEGNIELDASLTASDNAQAYFARYRKAREAEERVPLLLDVAQQRAAHLADLRALVELAEGMDSVRALRREVAAVTSATVRGGQPAAPDKKRTRTRSAEKAAGPYRRVSLGDGWQALVGTSAAGNAHITFDLAQADDLWLHARGVAGAHVILRTSGSSELPDHILERAARLAAWHSAARVAGSVEVDLVLRRYVKKVPNGPPGFVRFTNEKTVRVTPQAAEDH